MSSNISIFLVQLILIISANIVSTMKLPSYIKTCPRSTVDLNDCVIKLLNGLRPKLMSGIKEMNIPPLDPFNLASRIEWSQGTVHTILKARFDNITVTGLKNYEVTDVGITMNKPVINLKFMIPQLEISSDFKLNGRVFIIPLRGVGFFDGKFGDVKVSIQMIGDYVTMDGQRHFKFEEQRVTLNMTTFETHLHNLFNDDVEIGAMANDYINKNWVDIFNELRPLIEQSVNGVVKNFFDPIFLNFSLAELFPY